MEVKVQGGPGEHSGKAAEVRGVPPPTDAKWERRRRDREVVGCRQWRRVACGQRLSGVLGQQTLE